MKKIARTHVHTHIRTHTHRNKLPLIILILITIKAGCISSVNCRSVLLKRKPPDNRQCTCVVLYCFNVWAHQYRLQYMEVYRWSIYGISVYLYIYNYNVHIIYIFVLYRCSILYCIALYCWSILYCMLEYPDVSVSASHRNTGSLSGAEGVWTR